MGERWLEDLRDHASVSFRVRDLVEKWKKEDAAKERREWVYFHLSIAALAVVIHVWPMW